MSSQVAAQQPVATPVEAAVGEAIANEVSNESNQSNVENPSSNNDLQDQVEAAIESGASKEEVRQMIKEFKLKVNGKEIVKKLDLSDEKALLRELQIAESNKQGMSKAKELEKLFERELSRLKESPWEVLQELGHDPYALSEAKLAEWVEEQKKSPEQLEFEKMQKELKEAREEAKRLKDAQENYKFEQLKKQAGDELDKEIEAALASQPGLPKTSKTTARIADALMWAYDNGFPEATVADVLPMVQEDIKRETREFLESMNDDLFEQYIGQKNQERMRKKRLAQAKKAPVSSETKTTSAVSEAKPKEKIKAKDFFKNPLKYS